MRKLLLGRYSAVIFLDEEDAYLLDGIYDELRRKDTARLILDIAGVTLPDDELYIELFEKEGRNILFVTAGDLSLIHISTLSVPASAFLLRS